MTLRRHGLVVLALICAKMGGAQETGYYLDQGSGPMYYVREGDPATIHPDEWHVRLYRKGQGKGGRNNWGSLTGSSAAQVMKRLKANQFIEVSYCRFMHRIDDCYDDTFFNFTGPIAVVPQKPAHPVAEDLRRIHEYTDKMAKYRDLFDRYLELTGQKEKAESTPFSQTGSVFREYADALSDAQRRVLKLEARINEETSEPLASLQGDLASLDNDLQAAESRYTTLANVVDPPSLAMPGESQLGDGTAFEGHAGFKFVDSNYVDIKDGNLTVTTITSTTNNLLVVCADADCHNAPVVSRRAAETQFPIAAVTAATTTDDGLRISLRCPPCAVRRTGDLTDDGKWAEDPNQADSVTDVTLRIADQAIAQRVADAWNRVPHTSAAKQ